MKAFKIEDYIIIADLIEDAMNMFKYEISGYYPEIVTELDLNDEIKCEDGRVMTVKEIINETLDERQAWLRLGIPCEVYRPFLVRTSKD